jgi:hypothetical protein
LLQCKLFSSPNKLLWSNTFREHNTTARLVNSTLQTDTDPLSPLVNPQTNVAIQAFPLTSLALKNLTCKIYSNTHIYICNIYFIRDTEAST